MTERLQDFAARHAEEIECMLRAWLPISTQPGARRLNGALSYALFPGGKRMRPVLALLASRLAGATREQSLLIGCAVEFLHSSSLILDDLPGMDDAHLRRNRRTLHLVYGEGLAVLAAVALLNQAYSLFVRAARLCDRPGAVESLLREAVRAVGADGMIGGQAVDLETQGTDADAEALASRDLKTVALMRLMMIAGALAGGAADEDAEALAKFGEGYGRAYQICDDLLDESGESDLLGKTSGQDARHLRPTAVSVLGVYESRRQARKLVAEGARLLADRFGERQEVRILVDAAEMMIQKVAGASRERFIHANNAGRRTLETQASAVNE